MERNNHVLSAAEGNELVATHSLRSLRLALRGSGLRSGQAVQAWAESELPAGQALRQPAPLFRKLDESVVEEEYARLEG